MKSPQVIEFKGMDVALTALKASLRSTDPAEIEAALARIAKASPGFFSQEPVVVDLAELAEGSSADWPSLLDLLRRHGLHPIGVSNAGALAESAQAAGLALIEAAAANRPAAKPRQEPMVQPAAATLVIDKPLRSGQQVYARGGDVVLLAMVSAGAEVIADGHIHVYAPLRGRAAAGASGNAAARIFTTCFEAELVSIAGTYRTFEPGAAGALAGQPVTVRLTGSAEQQKLSVESLTLR